MKEFNNQEVLLLILQKLEFIQKDFKSISINLDKIITYLNIADKKEETWQ